MPARRPNIRSALIEFGLLASLMAMGAFGAGLLAAAGVVLLMQLYWAASRRSALSKMGFGKRLTSVFIASVIIVGAGAIAYLLGASLGEMGT